MLENEDPKKILPEEEKKNVLAILRNIYPPEKEKLGVVVFDLKTIPYRSSSYLQLGSQK